MQKNYDKEQGKLVYNLHQLIRIFLQIQARNEQLSLLASAYLLYKYRANIEGARKLEDLSFLFEADYFYFLIVNYINEKGIKIEKDIENDSSSACSLGILGKIESNRGNWSEAKRMYRQSLQLFEKLGDRSGIAFCWEGLADIESQQENWEVAEPLYRQSLQSKIELGERPNIDTCWNLGYIERQRRNWDEAEWLYQQALELNEELGDNTGIAISISLLGKTELERGNLEAAEPLLKEALVKVQELGMTLHIADINYRLAKLERQRGNNELAQEHYSTACQIFQQLEAVEDLERIDREWNN